MTDKLAKPFLKWAGGKTQLIEPIQRFLPKSFTESNFTYIEPFVGSGAILFWVLNNFPSLKKAVINDVNEDLINVYKTIATQPNELISILKILENEYHFFEFMENSEENKKHYYNQKRILYNTRSSEKSTQAALFIFLNRTCFNGLYRVNSKNKFNVPAGRYKKPTICNKDNIFAVHEALKKVEILCGDYEKTLPLANENTFFYLDPPYKPLNKTSNFNSYAKDEFGDEEQIRLYNFCKKLDNLGYNWILSNSDVKGKAENEDFCFTNFKKTTK
ncbi:MAG: modification methylase [Flexibacter sp. CG_4_10_14_3_um_filter_32_15]|nr:MAG: modification methylase [Flexibacter sp. CG_4_10_14_3_um_filter_32_15]